LRFAVRGSGLAVRGLRFTVHGLKESNQPFLLRYFLLAQHNSAVQEGFSKLLSGDHQVLLDREITRLLPATVIRLIEHGKQNVAEKLVDRVITGLGHKDEELRRTCASCLTAVADQFACRKDRQHLDRLLPHLKTVQQGRTGDGLTDEIRAAAGKVIAAAESGNGKTACPPPAPETKKKDTIGIREEQIFTLAESGNRDEAKRQLFDLVVSCARHKDFGNAERLRERIYEIDPMALMEIIQSGEIIEQEKTGSIDSDHLEVWANLLKELTSEEFNALYHEMEQRSYSQEETLASQGTKNDELFFINHGSVRISYFQTGMGGKKELFLKNLTSGEIVGENFFNVSVWSVSLTAAQQTQIFVLKRENLARLEERISGIESKLRDYYARSIDIASLLKKKGMDRRMHERYRLERKIHLQITGERGKILSSFKGEMADISQGGLSFVVRITKKENSRLLLGRNIKATIPLSIGREQHLHGTVSGVQSYDLVHSDYSVHVKFNTPLERQDLQILLE
jgi:CRP-like cAMP-binding protein